MFELTFNKTEKNIDELIRHIQEMTLITSRKSQMVDISKYYSALGAQKEHTASDPHCHTIPVPRNLHFFGREESLRQIEDYFKSPQALSGMSSLAIYGLGGVGKSQIALEYAWRKQADLDVVLWVPAENKTAILQALSSIATTALKLPNADPTSHSQNAVLIMEWLRTTGKPILSSVL